MKTTNLFLKFFLAVFLMASCGGTSHNSQTEYRSAASYNHSVEEQSGVSGQLTQKIIKEGYLSLEVRDVGVSMAFVREQVQAAGGSISSEGASEERTRISRNMVIRVPAENFEPLLAALEQHALKVVNKNISLRDVGEEFVDVEARLNTKKQLETRYIELLGKAKTVEELLSIEHELANVRGEIESMTGRLRYLTDKVALSTLNLDFYQPISPGAQFASRLGQSVAQGWYAFLGFLVWLTGLWPFVLLAILLVAVYNIRVRHQRKHN